MPEMSQVVSPQKSFLPLQILEYSVQQDAMEDLGKNIWKLC